MSDSPAKVTASPVSSDTAARNGHAEGHAYDIDKNHKSTIISSHSTTSGNLHTLGPPAANESAAEPSSETQSSLIRTTKASTPHSHLSTPNGEKQVSTFEGHDMPEHAGGTIIDKSGLAESMVENDDEDEVVYPGGVKLGLLTFGLCMATFTVALDITISATAIPKITTVFNSLDDVGWYGSSYLLTATALQPSFGRVYTYFNVKYTYLFALCLFELGSIICAATTSSAMLIVDRAIAGAGASALFSGGMTIVGFTVPLKKRPMYIAAISSMFGISSVIGPLLGGALTEKASWRWCFWFNLPFGVIALGAVFSFFRPPERKNTNMTLKQRTLEIDLLGALFLICAIVCLLLALQWGETTYPWRNSKVWGCLLGFGLLLIIFIFLQFRRGDRATVPPRIFGQRTVLWACLYSSFLSMGLYTHIYYLPFYFQAVKGTTAEGSGIRTIPYLGSVIISSIVAEAGITVFGFYKPFMIFGGAIFTLGAGMVYTLGENSDTGKWVGYQLLCGFGAGAGVQIPFIAVQVVLDNKDMPTGNTMARERMLISMLVVLFNTLRGAISISIAQNIFSNGLSNNLPKYAPQLSASDVINLGATQLREFVTSDLMPGVLKAYMLALNQAYVLPIAVGGIAMVCACLFEWKSVKGKAIVAAAAYEDSVYK